MFLRPARSLLPLSRTRARISIPVPRYTPSLFASRSFTTSFPQFEQPSSPAPTVDTSGTKTPIGPAAEETKPCHHRSTHEFSRRSYEKGIVLIECPGCGNRHLIADNLQWFSSTPSPSHPSGLPIGSEEERKPRTVEQLMKEKGEQVVWVDGGKEGGTWMVEG
ncbi:DNL zinc finger-domain-containing protein [Leucosporidium creatinivorum]|uniref:DNL zinc finger-domain-containing protein n=1 Tax=Leucosporidium creatinivorum TaxID=106004 RepID=A0A1Y2EC79_9BASI|nr:DNL zinc finger-domain-containing protein [Leucosporidium creatinivorum]